MINPSPNQNLHTDGHATLKSIMEGTAIASGDLFFQTLVQYLAVSLSVKASFIAEFDASRTSANTMAVWIDSQHAENFNFDLDGTPCKHVLAGEVQHYADNIQTTFPSNKVIKQLSARSYLAIPLTDDAGAVVGHLAVLDDKPLIADQRELSIFHIFAARATAELARRQTEQKFRDSQKRESELLARHKKIEAEVSYLREELRARSNFAEIVGESDGIWRVLRNVDLVAPTDSTVLILGETGTGKELVARAIHKSSKRREGPFIRVNCAALPESLLESELFGHESGAFTGATLQRTGRFELADQGTIFLDEIGEMTLAAQSRLLRVLQENELERVGGSKTISIDTRILAATNRDLADMVKDGTFREDLYYRLNVFPIQVPPLRNRLEDIPALVSFFTDKLSKRLGKNIRQVPIDVLEELQSYSWKGNVRELENVIERAMILSIGETLELPEGAIPRPKAETSETLKSLVAVETAHIETVLKHTDGVIAGPSGAAQVLKMNPNTLRSRIEKLGIVVPRNEPA